MESRHIYAFTGFQIVVACVFLWFLATWKGPWNVQRLVGTVLVVVGLLFISVARYQLGRSFSIKAEAHQLVTTGLYSKIRNPVYVFGIVMLTGMILVLQRPEGWLVLVAAIVGQTIRARREARVLEAAFGDEYREYRRKTWF
ncbi:MAG TPA: isoprenylcysteine carboxylmethyltransferase family protein [Candidatus Binatus sp.]|jgi:protein-S-isoprenylcysteine O-methyltransferase Ste14|nr:isoprenylcysteine carboxylmethyltransferase family protein [Candidatus Binatus sp.]